MLFIFINHNFFSYFYRYCCCCVTVYQVPQATQEIILDTITEIFEPVMAKVSLSVSSSLSILWVFYALYYHIIGLISL